ncbi:MAG: class I SAM-dependent methyltransferase [Deltaproteobacteria bacterium]|nr:class I SAM-dependent methyltransferase [Deltaproteobacteria bacterium]
MDLETLKPFWEYYRQKRSDISNFDTFCVHFFGHEFWGPHQKRVQLLTTRTGGLQEPILEVGCGAGWLTYHLHKSGLKSVGIDLLEEQLAQSRLFFEYFNMEGCWAQSNLLQLPFPDHYFSSVIAFDVLEHVDRLGQALREIRRVLKPTGTLFVTIPNGWGSYCMLEDRWHKRFNLPLRHWVKCCLRQKWEKRKKEGVVLHHVHIHGKNWWKKQFSLHGFQMKKIKNLEMFSTSVLARGGYAKNAARSQRDALWADKFPNCFSSEWFLELTP